ncbi:PadR family transcriptional regulator [Myxococcota bacterium]|nr:PadR family transcriptional regulator [Myxococcota bacterium]
MRGAIEREIGLAFCKMHILHHAVSRDVYGLWLLEELADHGHRLSPGTLYPLLARMERNGWLCSVPGQSEKARRNYRITPLGRQVLAALAPQIAELHREVVLKVEPVPAGAPSPALPRLGPR